MPEWLLGEPDRRQVFRHMAVDHYGGGHFRGLDMTEKYHIYSLLVAPGGEKDCGLGIGEYTDRADQLNRHIWMEVICQDHR